MKLLVITMSLFLISNSVFADDPKQTTIINNNYYSYSNSVTFSPVPWKISPGELSYTVPYNSPLLAGNGHKLSAIVQIFLSDTSPSDIEIQRCLNSKTPASIKPGQAFVCSMGYQDITIAIATDPKNNKGYLPQDIVGTYQISYQDSPPGS